MAKSKTNSRILKAARAIKWYCKEQGEYCLNCVFFGKEGCLLVNQFCMAPQDWPVDAIADLYNKEANDENT